MNVFLKSKKIQYVIFLSVIILIELFCYNIIQQKVTYYTLQEVDKYRKDFFKEIQELSEYKDRIVIGRLGGFAPKCRNIDLGVFNPIIIGPHKTLEEKYEADFVDFINYFSKSYSITKNHDTSNYKIITQLDCLYKIDLPETVWTIQEMGGFSDSEGKFYVQTIKPIALGYKKCSNYEKALRPDCYDVCVDVFNYLTTEGRYSKEYINKSNLINSILELENKYFAIEPSPIVDEKENPITLEQKKENSNFYVFSYVHNGFYALFYNESSTSTCEEYEVVCKINVLNEEISNNTNLYFLSISAILFFIFGIAVIFIHILLRKKWILGHKYKSMSYPEKVTFDTCFYLNMFSLIKYLAHYLLFGIISKVCGWSCSPKWTSDGLRFG